MSEQDSIPNSVFSAVRHATVLYVAPLITALFVTCLALAMYGLFFSVYLGVSLVKISGYVLLHLGTTFAVGIEIIFQLICRRREFVAAGYCITGIILILLNWLEFGTYFELRGLNVLFRDKINDHINTINTPPRRRVIRGLTVTAFGLAALIIGSLLSRGLLAMGNVLLLTGVVFTLKTERVFRFLFQAKNANACFCVILGILLVVHDWSMIGMGLQVTGAFVLRIRNADRNEGAEQPQGNFDLRSVLTNSQTVQTSMGLGAVGLLASALGLFFSAGLLFSLGMLSLLAALVNFVGIRSFFTVEGLVAVVASAVGLILGGPVVAAVMLLLGASGITAYHAWRIRDLYNFTYDPRFQVCLGMSAVVLANTLLGILFLFHPVLTSCGQIFLLAGLVPVCGLDKFKSLVKEAEKLEGFKIICFGALMIILGFPILGVFVEGYGVFYVISLCPRVVYILEAVYPAVSNLCSYVWRWLTRYDELPNIQDLNNDDVFVGLLQDLFQSVSAIPQRVDEQFNNYEIPMNEQPGFAALVGKFLHGIYEAVLELPNYVSSLGAQGVNYLQGVSQAVYGLCSYVWRLVTSGDKLPRPKDLQNDEGLASHWQSLVESMNGQMQVLEEQVGDIAPDEISMTENHGRQAVQTGVELVTLGLATVALSGALSILLCAGPLFSFGSSVAIAGLVHVVGVSPFLNLKGLGIALSAPLLMAVASPEIGYSLLLFGASAAVAKCYARCFSNFYNFTDDPKLQICMGMSVVVLFTSLPGTVFVCHHAMLILLHILLATGVALFVFGLTRFKSLLNEADNLEGSRFFCFGILMVLFGFPKIGICFEVFGIYFLIGNSSQANFFRDFCNRVWRRLRSRVSTSDVDIPRFPDLLKDAFFTAVHVMWSVADYLLGREAPPRGPYSELDID